MLLAKNRCVLFSLSRSSRSHTATELFARAHALQLREATQLE